MAENETYRDVTFIEKRSCRGRDWSATTTATFSSALPYSSVSESVPKSCWDKRELILLLFLRPDVLGFKGVSGSKLSGGPTANSLSSSGGGRGADDSGGHPEFVCVSIVADGHRRGSLTEVLARGNFRGTSFHGRRVTPRSSGLSRGSSPGREGKKRYFNSYIEIIVYNRIFTYICNFFHFLLVIAHPHHGLRWNDGVVPYRMAQRLISEAVLGESEAIVYVKGSEKREWLSDILNNDDVVIETIDTHYEDIEPLKNLDATNTFRCGRHSKHCALENVLKLFKRWIRFQSK
ncbi:hypothetical protein ALC60_05093 [Trachymyrmex zeteki]|uniref:Uncharacterized protein n=1 Tax=Mycetomoellerius zeteki TaxID=64791 RepID=A0A151X6M9_9HYME|nr:hypothetical protein ALC60_05093 [Trachymyrmex zeteki]